MEVDFSGYTQATPSDPMDDRGFAGTGSTEDQFQDILDSSTQFGDTTGGDSVDFSDFSSAGFAGGAPRSNITNSSSYDPTFAALDQLSRGLDPRDLKDYQNTAFAKQNVDGIMSLRPNSLQQLNQPQVDRITEALKLSGNTDAYKQVSSLRGDDLKNYAAGMDLKSLNLSDFDKMDTQSLANIFSSLGMSEKNPYGISAQGSQAGITGVISNLLGADTNPDFRGSMSSKDIAETARSGLGFITGSGQLNPNAAPRNPMEFGSVSGIANQFGRDVSAGAKQIQNDLMQLADGAMSYFSNQGKAGDTVENIVAEQRGKEIAQLEKERLEQGLNTSFEPITLPTITKENVLNNSFMDSGASLATNPEGIANTTVGKEVASNLSVAPELKSDLERALERSRESAETIDSRLGQKKTNDAVNAVFDMLNKNTSNVEIDAGANKGEILNVNPFDRESKDIKLAQAMRDAGYNYSIPNPSLGNPEYASISLKEDQNPVFAGTNQSILGGKDSQINYTSPFTENELKTMTNDGFNLGAPTYEELPSFVVPINSLNPTAQEVNALRSNMDYGKSFPLQTILDGRRSVRDGIFSQDEMNKYISGL